MSHGKAGFIYEREKEGSWSQWQEVAPREERPEEMVSGESLKGQKKKEKKYPFTAGSNGTPCPEPKTSERWD